MWTLSLNKCNMWVFLFFFLGGGGSKGVYLSLLIGLESVREVKRWNYVGCTCVVVIFPTWETNTKRAGIQNFSSSSLNIIVPYFHDFVNIVSKLYNPCLWLLFLFCSLFFCFSLALRLLSLSLSLMIKQLLSRFFRDLKGWREGGVGDSNKAGLGCCTPDLIP